MKKKNKNKMQENKISSVKCSRKTQILLPLFLSRLVSGQSAKFFMTEVGSLYLRTKSKCKASHIEASIVLCTFIIKMINS